MLLPDGDALTGTATGVDPDGQLLVTTARPAPEPWPPGTSLHLR